MISSMTAFARERSESELGSLTLELRSVNHRYLDCSFKLPEALRALEVDWRERIAGSLARGKIDVQLRYQPPALSAAATRVDAERLHALAEARSQAEAALGELALADFISVLQWPGVLQVEEPDGDALSAQATRLLQAALDNLRDNRTREGAKLAGFIIERLDAVMQVVADTRAILPDIIEHQRSRTLNRLAELDAELDQERLEQEMVLLAQKTDVEEELDRLQAHVDEVRSVLAKGGPCGRRLDFLMQELNREANTLSSKSIASSSTKNAVELKVLIEQMREQIQNLE